MATGLDLFQAFVVIDVLRVLTEVDDDLRVSIGQEPVHGVPGIKALVIAKTLDKCIEWKGGEVYLENHVSLQFI